MATIFNNVDNYMESGAKGNTKLIIVINWPSLSPSILWGFAVYKPFTKS